jgi:hypothetical protein
MTASLIHFVCVRADHRPRNLAAEPALTIHGGLWAYCRQSASGEHEWLHISPRSRNELARWGRSFSDRAPNF